MKTTLYFTLGLILPITSAMWSFQKKDALQYADAVTFHQKIGDYFKSNPDIQSAAIQEGAGLAKLIRSHVSKVYFSSYDKRVVVIYCGPGGNGEEGVNTGLFLAEYQINVWLVFDCDPNPNSATYQTALQNTRLPQVKEFITLKYMNSDDTKVVTLIGLEATEYERGYLTRKFVFGVVDAIFGYPQKRNETQIDGNYLIMMEEIHVANEHGVASYSLDTPTGVDPDTGMVVYANKLPKRMRGNQYRQPKHVVFMGCIKAMVFRNPYQFYYIVNFFVHPSVIVAFKAEKPNTQFRLPSPDDYNGGLCLMLE